jgi:hypothetical protein
MWPNNITQHKTGCNTGWLWMRAGNASGPTCGGAKRLAGRVIHRKSQKAST